jgi:hypothetical protein
MMTYTLKNGNTIIASSNNVIYWSEEQKGWQIENLVLVDTEKQYTLIEPPVVPNSVSPFQARSALLAAGLLETVDALVSNTGGQVKIAWEYATVFQRNSQFILSMQPLLNLTDEQIDELFIVASTIS